VIILYGKAKTTRFFRKKIKAHIDFTDACRNEAQVIMFGNDSVVAICIVGVVNEAKCLADTTHRLSLLP